jgi:hypothetical protein
MKLLAILRMLIPPVSQHVRKLKEGSLAEPTKEARIYYSFIQKIHGVKSSSMSDKRELHR